MRMVRERRDNAAPAIHRLAMPGSAGHLARVKHKEAPGDPVALVPAPEAVREQVALGVLGEVPAFTPVPAVHRHHSPGGVINISCYHWPIPPLIRAFSRPAHGWTTTGDLGDRA